MPRFTDETEQALRDAGWTPGRTVDTRSWRQRLEKSGIVFHDAAQTFLAEFGGLSVDVDGPGISCARSPFELDPDLTDGEEDRFADWSQEIGAALVPIGELDQGRYFLGISDSAELFVVADWISSLGTGDEGLERLIRGIEATPVHP